MPLPTRKLILLLLLPAPVLVLNVAPAVLMSVAAYDLGVLALAAMEWLRGTGRDDLRIERQVPARFSLDEPTRVGWQVRNTTPHAINFQLVEDIPERFAHDALPIVGRIAARSADELHYTVRPAHRGTYTFGDIWVRWTGPLGLIQRQHRVHLQTQVTVYPNVATARRYELAAQHRAPTELGLIAMRRRGRGSIFESLREYVPGDDLADIAWKATARRARLMTRNYEVERSQNLLIMLDCGRLMTPTVDGLSRLDHAINAAMLLTYVAQKQGDRIGVLAFSDRIEAYRPPTKGQAAIGAMRQTLARLEPVVRESDYTAACRYVALRHRKRSLVLIVTDVIDREASSALLQHAARFARAHTVLCVTLRDLDIERETDHLPEAADACYRQAMAMQLHRQRELAIEQMRRTGVSVLDAHPRRLTPQLLDRYLELKHRRTM